MDSQRNLFFIAFLLVSFLLWQTWQTDKTSVTKQGQATAEQPQLTDNAKQNSVGNQADKFITVKTDVFTLMINTRGGDIVQASLPSYADKLGSSHPFQLLETTPDFVYQAQSGLIGNDGPDNATRPERPLYTASRDLFVLDADQAELTVPLSLTTQDGVTFAKTFIFKRGEYAIGVNYHINNTSQKPVEVEMYGQLKQTAQLPKRRDTGSSNFALHTFRGIAYSTQETKYEKYKFDNVEKNEQLEKQTANGWVAMLQQYFTTAWVPTSKGNNAFFTRKLDHDQVAVGYKSAPVRVAVGEQRDLSAILWVGPNIQDKMAAIAPHLDLTVDYGWLWFISQPLFKLLKFLHGFIGNWGFSIIVITFIVRGIMYPLTKAQYTSMAKMRVLQPKIQSMRERYADDKPRMSQEMMALYKTEKVNPLGGCLPLLIQMPIFLALYYMLMGSVELRHAPFMLWIRDLSAQDPWYILPILMGITMFFIQKMSPTTVTDPLQQKIMTFMPVVFTIFFLWFPSGLVLYYIVSNLVTIIQQQLIYRSLEKNGLHSRDKK